MPSVEEKKSNAKERKKEKLKRLRGEIDIKIEQFTKNILPENFPTTLPVENFAAARVAEISRLITQDRINKIGQSAHQTIPRHLRRRSMARNVHILPSRLRRKAIAEQPKEAAKIKLPKRRKKRCKSVLTESRRIFNKQSNSKWLETHRWSIKRMFIANLWGYKIAMTPTAKSVKFAQKRSLTECSLFDKSFMPCVEITVLHSLKNRKEVLVSLFSGLNINDPLKELEAFLQKGLNGDSISRKTILLETFNGIEFVLKENNLYCFTHPSVYEKFLLQLDKSKTCLLAKNLDSLVVEITPRRTKFVRFQLNGKESLPILLKTLKLRPDEEITRLNEESPFVLRVSGEEKMELIVLPNRFKKSELLWNRTEFKSFDVLAENSEGYSLWLRLIENGATAIGIKNFNEICLGRNERVFPVDFPKSAEFVRFYEEIGNFKDESEANGERFNQFKEDNRKTFKKSKMAQFYIKNSELFPFLEKIQSKNSLAVRIRLDKGNPSPSSRLFEWNEKETREKCVVKAEIKDWKEIGMTYRKMYSWWNGCVIMAGMIIRGEIGDEIKGGKVWVYDTKSKNAYSARWEIFG